MNVFFKSNSSFLLCSGNALKSSILRSSLRKEVFLVDAFFCHPIKCMQDEPTSVPINPATRFENKLGLQANAQQRKVFGLPKRFRQNRAWIELKTKLRVKGFLLQKDKVGYSVAIAGFVAFIPLRSLITHSISNEIFTIESIHPGKILVF
ncbi:hypothetical protein QJS04_geneDACA024292 [Acorus gramineus]|uniref:Ribosomal protein S1 n=1 Tax=Acorus gramineus TaxID=55184 RepID=A0AAV9A3I2_ACOGR|nr:hypothetical protein QJS04_geneDACA024292 [Acorus gramineus]